MVTFDPDKKKTKRGFWRSLFSPFIGASVRRARLQTRDVKDARAKLKKTRSEKDEIKELRRKGILK